jgi:N6-L-threonylcarbamoyladenine synthase
MIVLGIETSCDETSVAIVNSNREIIAQKTISQILIHQQYGGVVPEIASRNHIEYLPYVIRYTFAEANLTINNIDAIAVTAGPGLIGGILVGVMMAKGMAAAANIPFLAVNHLEGHALTTRLSDNTPFPFLLLLVSGGHCQILQVAGVGQYTLYGQTMDDAIGESFDKVARMLGLNYPGGPEIEKLAQGGDNTRFAFPRPMIGRSENCDFSLSGLKTAVRRTIETLGVLSTQDKADVAASFQTAIADVIIDRLKIALNRFKKFSNARVLVVAGGVASNKYLINTIKTLSDSHDFILNSPPINLCTDNAAMIAWVGIEKLQLNQVDSLNFEPLSRWPLESLSE